MLSYTMRNIEKKVRQSTLFQVHHVLYTRDKAVKVRNITIYPQKIYDELNMASDLNAIKENELLQDIIWNECMVSRDVAEDIQQECIDFFIEGKSNLAAEGFYPIDIIQTSAYLKALLSIASKIHNGKIEGVMRNAQHLSMQQRAFLEEKKNDIFQRLLICFIKDKNDPLLKKVPPSWENILYLAEQNLLTRDFLKKDLFWNTLNYLLRYHHHVCEKFGLDLWLEHDTKKTLSTISTNIFAYPWVNKKEGVAFLEKLSHKDSLHYALIPLLSHFNKEPKKYYQKLTDLPLPIIFDVLYNSPATTLATSYKVPGDISFQEWRKNEKNISDVLGNKRNMKKEMFKKFIDYNMGIAGAMTLEEIDVYYE